MHFLILNLQILVPLADHFTYLLKSRIDIINIRGISLVIILFLWMCLGFAVRGLYLKNETLGISKAYNKYCQHHSVSERAM